MMIQVVNKLLYSFASFLLCFSLYAQNSDCTYFESYDDVGDWTLTLQGQEIGCSGDPRGNILFEDGVMKWEVVRDGGYDTRYFKELGFTLCDSWSSEIDVTIQAGGSGSVGPFALEVLAFTSGSKQILDYYVGSNILLANQDGVIIRLTSSGQTNWMFEVILRDGTTKETVATIPISNTYGVSYHVEIQRINTNYGYITVTSNDFTPPFSASACFNIPSTITDLTHIQQGNSPIGGCVRRFTGELDNVCIKNCTNNAVELINGITEYSVCSDIPFITDLAESIPGNTYEWIPTTDLSNPNILNPTITVNEPTDYMVIVTNGCGLSDTLSISINIISSNILSLGNDTTLCDGGNIILKPDSIIEGILWITNETSDSIIVNQSGTYWATFPNNICTYTDSVEITLLDNLLIEIENPETSCIGSEIIFSLSNWIYFPEQVDLSMNFGNMDSIQVSSDSVVTIYTEPGDYSIALTGFILGCPFNQSSSITIEAPLEFEIESPSQICSGETFNLDFSTLGFQVLNESNSPVLEFETDTAGIYEFHAENTCGEVISELIIEVITIDPMPTANEVLICPPTDSVLIGFESNNYIYYWANNENTRMLQVYQPDTFLVVVSDSLGTCSKTYSFIVFEPSLMEYSIFDTELIEFCVDDNRTISLPNYGHYYVLPNGELGYSFTPPESGFYTVAFNDECLTYSETIEVIIDPCLCTMLVPNIFTPNGDGMNDIFLPEIKCEVEYYSLKVLNRWGSEIFESNNLNEGWNGQIKNNADQLASDGEYMYLIQYSQKVGNIVYTTNDHGILTLIR